MIEALLPLADRGPARMGDPACTAAMVIACLVDATLEDRVGMLGRTRVLTNHAAIRTGHQLGHSYPTRDPFGTKEGITSLDQVVVYPNRGATVRLYRV